MSNLLQDCRSYYSAITVTTSFAGHRRRLTPCRSAAAEGGRLQRLVRRRGHPITVAPRVPVPSRGIASGYRPPYRRPGAPPRRADRIPVARPRPSGTGVRETRRAVPGTDAPGASAFRAPRRSVQGSDPWSSSF